MKSTLLTGLIVYGMISVFTFGQAFVSSKDSCVDTFNPSECQSVTAFLNASLWPLYWSVQLATGENDD